ncbi:hypothetical protein AX774_g6235 [Zancudomyces culisetae]|uniref:Uncharacterized protein n=1 Tax=Zancudomyces culisetae TaxID=1213189 RepID=A0A1R1PHA6_ZANCU|nr:hypothetical protein AX774_g6235 [Zancudomyces culisetae]|eukprot:OMH80328.1 hypothetical protein AX774_g6235 [Zancudomyces culisetae]
MTVEKENSDSSTISTNGDANIKRNEICVNGGKSKLKCDEKTKNKQTSRRVTRAARHIGMKSIKTDSFSQHQTTFLARKNPEYLENSASTPDKETIKRERLPKNSSIICSAHIPGKSIKSEQIVCQQLSSISLDDPEFKEAKLFNNIAAVVERPHRKTRITSRKKLLKLPSSSVNNHTRRYLSANLYPASECSSLQTTPQVEFQRFNLAENTGQISFSKQKRCLPKPAVPRTGETSNGGSTGSNTGQNIPGAADHRHNPYDEPPPYSTVDRDRNMLYSGYMGPMPYNTPVVDFSTLNLDEPIAVNCPVCRLEVVTIVLLRPGKYPILKYF